MLPLRTGRKIGRRAGTVNRRGGNSGRDLAAIAKRGDRGAEPARGGCTIGAAGPGRGGWVISPPFVVEVIAMADVPLSRVERLALRFAEISNEDPRGKWMQTRFLRGVSYVWVRAFLANRVLVEGLEDLMALQPET